MERVSLQNLYTTVSQQAPGLLEAAVTVNSPGDLYMLPTHQRSISARLALLIRNDIYAAFGREVRNASQYEELLHWIQEQFPGIAPSVAAPLHTDIEFGSNIGYTALNLFLPEMGYTSLSGLFNQGFLLENNLWLNPEQEVLPFYDIDAAVTAFERFADWNRRGLVEFREDLNDTALANSPTILISMLNMDFDFDPTAFSINIFPEPALDWPSIETVAFAAKNVDTSEFVRFMKWLEDIENYVYFLFGIEGEDHLRDRESGYVVEWQLPGSMLYNSPHRAVFSRDIFNDQLIDMQTVMPRRYFQEKQNLEAQPFLLDRYRAYQIASQLNNPLYRQSYIGAVTSYMNVLLNSLYGPNGAIGTMPLIQETFYNLRAINPNPRPADLVNEALEE